MQCTDFALTYQVPTMSLVTMIDLNCLSLTNDTTYCIPDSCPVAVVANRQSYQPLVNQYDNMTYNFLRAIHLA
jgi:hypothetical protein